jgi:hypothetical protein
MPLAGLAHAKVDQIPRSTPSRILEAGASSPVAASPTGHKGPATAPNLRFPAPLPRPTPVQAVCYHPAPPQAPSDKPATAMEACTDPAAVLENELSGPGNPGSAAQDHAQAQRARAARCAANNSAPVGQSAVTVSSRRDSDWRPGPIRLPFTRAPSGAACTAAARPRSTRRRDLANR